MEKARGNACQTRFSIRLCIWQTLICGMVFYSAYKLSRYKITKEDIKARSRACKELFQATRPGGSTCILF